MVDRLLANKARPTGVWPWRPALTTVPRHEFIPGTVWIKNPNHWPTLLPVHRDDDPARWLQLTYGDSVVITQVDDGHPEGPGPAGAMQTSSASAPDIVAVMLAALDAHLGHRVLEIGTGTRYNSALLAHRLGAHQTPTWQLGRAGRWLISSTVPELNSRTPRA